MRAITLIGLGSVITVLIANALLRGPWLDEFWSQKFSDTSIGIVPLVRDRWLHDMSPPLFSVWTTVMAVSGLESIPALRLITNVPPLLTIIFAARCFTRRMPEQQVFHTALLLLVLSTPIVVTAFANYRSYFWQIAAMILLTQLARHIALTDEDLDPKRDKGLAALAIVACMSSIMFHYISGLFGAALSAAILFCAIARKFRRWASLMAVTIAMSCIVTLVVAAIQAPHWDLNHRWITDGTGSPLILVSILAAKALVHDPVPLVGLKGIGSTWRRGDSLFAITISAALISMIALSFLIDAYASAIVDRYLLGIPILIGALMAILATKFGHDGKWLAVLAAVAAASVIGPFLWRGPSRQWQANADQIAGIVKACPATKVYAATGWLLRKGGNSPFAANEYDVMARGYTYLAGRNGFAFQMIPRTGQTQAIPGECPTLLWIEHVPLGRFEPRQILAAAQLQGLEKAKLSLMRSETGLIVRADRQ